MTEEKWGGAQGPRAGHGRNWRRWTPEEDERVRRSQLSDGELAARLSRTSDAVRMRRRKLRVAS